MRYAFVLVFFALAACSTWTGPPKENRFARAAESWTGAPLDEMIAVYGPPRTFLEDSEVAGAGIAVWRSSWSDEYRCNISAWYDPDRIVTRIDVASHRCDEKYAEHLDMLMRKAP